MIFLLLGFCAVLGAQLLERYTVASGVLVNIGVVFLAVVVLAEIWTRLGGDPARQWSETVEQQIRDLDREVERLRDVLTVVRDAERVGLRGITSRSDDYLSPQAWRDLLRNTRRRVDLSGTAQYGWLRDTDFFRRTVREGISKGCNYQMMLYAPLLPESSDSHPLHSLLREEADKSSGTVGHNYEALRFFAVLESDCAEAGPGSFRLQVVDTKVQYFIVSRFDDRLLVTSYLSHKRSEGAPLLDIDDRDSELFTIFSTEFEDTWQNRARPLTARERTHLRL